MSISSVPASTVPMDMGSESATDSSSSSSVGVDSASHVATATESSTASDANAIGHTSGANPLRTLLQGADVQVKHLLAQAGKEKMQSLNGPLFDAIQDEFPPKPKAFHLFNSAKHKANYAALRTELESCSQKCHASSVALSGLTLGNFSSNRAECEAAIRNYIDAHYAMNAALKDMGKEVPKSRPFLQAQMQSCQNRIGEAINLITSMMHEQLSPQNAQQKVGDIMPAMALEMHGQAQSFDSIKDEVAAYMAKAQSIVTGQAFTDHDAFELAVNDIQGHMKGLIQNIEPLLTTEKATKTPTLVAEKNQFIALQKMLSTRIDQLETLKNLQPLQSYIDAVYELAIPNGPLTLDLPPRHQNTPQASEIKAIIDTAVGRFNTATANLIPDLQSITNTQTVHDFQSEASRLVDNLSRAIHECKVACGQEYNWQSLDIVLQHHQGIVDTLRPLCESAVHFTQRTHENKALLQLAIEQNLDMKTVIMAAEYGLSPQDIQLEARPELTVSPPQALGSGQINAVQQATFRGTGFNDLKVVWKAETPARTGLMKTFGTYGESAGLRAVNLNVASGRVARMIGCNDVLVTSKVGCLDGEFGLFMSRASGKDASTVMDSMGPILAEAKKEGTLPTLRANLLKNLSKLDWADALCGQADRHAGNYFIDMDPKTGAVRVTGIDNDAAFSEARVGVMKIDMSKAHGAEPLCRRFADAMTGDILDVSRLPKDHVAFLFSQMGVKQMPDFSYIDGKVYTKLMTMDVMAYRESLRPLLTPDALNAAVLRLQDAQDHALKLFRQGKVVDDWTDVQLLTHNLVFPEEHGVVPTFGVRNPLAVRDFSAHFDAMK